MEAYKRMEKNLVRISGNALKKAQTNRDGGLHRQLGSFELLEMK